MNLLKSLRRHPVITGVAAVIASAGIFAGVLHAWGPSDRAVFTMANPATYVTFNSITDNPKHGDERNFVQIRNYTDNGQFGENVDLVAGKEYEVYVFYHNNASTDLNDAYHNYKGVALNTYMKVQMPATVASGASARVTGFVGASNANPLQVWDEAYGKNTANGTVALRYVQNSAKITSNGAVNGKTLDLTKLASDNGALLGYDALDGKLPGCTQYSGYVTYRFVVDQPNFEISKQVSVAGANNFVESVNVNPGSKVDYKIKYKNTGTVAQNNVTIKDVLPAGLSYIAGTTYYSSSKTNNQWAQTNSNALTADGINFGSFAPGAALYVKFQATVASNDSLATCGVNNLVNNVMAITENGTKSDTATVTATKTCTTEKKVTVCDITSGTVVTIDESVYNANSDKYADKDSDKCKVTEVTELPETGIAEGVLSLIGLGALTYAGYAYIASRRA